MSAPTTVRPILFVIEWSSSSELSLVGKWCIRGAIIQLSRSLHAVKIYLHRFGSASPVRPFVYPFHHHQSRILEPDYEFRGITVIAQTLAIWLECVAGVNIWQDDRVNNIWLQISRSILDSLCNQVVNESDSELRFASTSGHPSGKSTRSSVVKVVLIKSRDKQERQESLSEFVGKLFLLW